jgi:hypothetical protein
MKNKYLYSIICVALLVSGIAISCSDINDMQREWLNQGETIYAGKVDSLKAHGGHNKIQLKALTHYARSIDKCVVTFGEEVREFDWADIVDDKEMTILFENMNEGTYHFKVQTFDKAGNGSLAEECIGYSYGDEFILTGLPKRIQSMTINPSFIELYWNESEDAELVAVRYETSENTFNTVTLPGNVITSRISDWKAGGKLEITTYVFPEKDAYEMIPLPVVEDAFPADKPDRFLLPKNLFKAAVLPTDIAGNGYSGKIEGIWDGVLGSGSGNRYHSANGDGVPHHLTFDAGVYADLKTVTIVGRAGYHNWNPRHFQLWGIAYLTGAETTLPSADPGWEAESVAKGWKLLLDARCEDNETNTFEFDTELTKNVRYIRYRHIESVGPPATGSSSYGCVQEMTFWGSSYVVPE